MDKETGEYLKLPSIDLFHKAILKLRNIDYHKNISDDRQQGGFNANKIVEYLADYYCEKEGIDIT